MKNYQYILKYNHILDPIPNSGYTGTTDWTNDVGGIAEGWELSSTGGTPSIVVSAGFTGNAQRFVKDSTDEQGLKSYFSIKCNYGNLATLKLRYAANATDWDVWINDVLIGTLSDTSSIPAEIELDFIPNRYSIDKIEIKESGTGSPAEFIIDELRIQLIESDEETLIKNPIGWNDLGITFERNMTYQSILRDFSLSLRFTKKPGAGGTNIETAYYLDGISGSVEIEIYERNPQTNDYDLFYTGILDFHPKRFKNLRDWVEAGIVDSGKLQKFKAREEVNFDLNSVVSADDVAITPFSNQPFDVIFKPIDIYLNLNCSGNYADEIFFSTVSNPPINPPTEYGFPGATWYAPESEAFIKLWVDTIIINEWGEKLQSESGPDFLARSLYIFVNETDSISEITVSEFTVTNNTLKVAMREFSGLDAEQTIYELVANTYDEDDNIITTRTFDTVIKQRTVSTNPYIESIVLDWSGVSGTVYLVPAGGKMTIAIRVTTNALANWDLTSSHYIYGTMDVDLVCVEKSLSIGQTAVKCFHPFEAFTRLIQLMTSETDTAKLFESNYLGRNYGEFVGYAVYGPGASDLITTGWNLRGFPDKAFNVNLRDLFVTFANVHGLGLGYDRVGDFFYIEPVGQFYDSGYFMFDLGEVAKLEKNPYDEAFNSKVASGYNEKGDYEDFQGVNEFNLESEHVLPLPVKNTKAGRGLYNYDSIGMELARRAQYSLNASKDTKYDEKIYIVYTGNGSYTIQGGPDLSGFDGIDQYYNLRYTPRENLIRNANFYKSGLWNHNLLIKFVRAAKDKNIEYTNQNGDLVNEFDDLSGADLQDPALFIPETYEFEAPFTPAILAILNSNPHGYIRFSFDGKNYEGYLLTVESGYYNRKAQYKLLAKEPTYGDNYIFEDDLNYVFEDTNNDTFD